MRDAGEVDGFRGSDSTQAGRPASAQDAIFSSAAAVESVIARLKSIELVRFFYAAEKSYSSHLAIRSERSFTICNDLLLPTSQLCDKLAHSTQTDIREAEALGDRVQIARNGDAPMEDFLAVFNDFARRKAGVRPISVGLLNYYSPYVDRMVLYLDRCTTSVMLTLRDSTCGRVRGLYNGSRRMTAPPRRARSEI